MLAPPPPPKKKQEGDLDEPALLDRWLNEGGKQRSPPGILVRRR